MARHQYDSTIRLLAIFAEHLATVSNQLLLREATPEADVITNARRFIATHHHEPLGLGDVARAVHLSAPYFCKVFKQATGFSFTEYLARVRVEAVKRIMLTAHWRISEAAFAAGFQSLAQFNRVFLRLVGETPSNFRLRRPRGDFVAASR